MNSSQVVVEITFPLEAAMAQGTHELRGGQHLKIGTKVMPINHMKRSLFGVM